MSLKQGEVYVCKDPKCGCEITVTKGAAAAARIWQRSNGSLVRPLKAQAERAGGCRAGEI